MRLIWFGNACAIGALLSVHASQAQAPPLRLISSSPGCPGCRIVLEPGPALELPRDSLSFSIVPSFLRLATGSFVAWRLNETRSPALFDSAGRFVKLAAGMGPGPGEISSVDAVVVTLSDSVWVIDRARRHVFTPDMQFTRTEHARTAYDILDGPGGTIVVAERIPTPERAGYPLHLLNRSGQIVRSFGAFETTIDPRKLAAVDDTPEALQIRNLTRGADHTFWAWNLTRFLLEQYDFRGRLLSHGRHALDGWYQDATERLPSKGEFKGLRLVIVQQSDDPRVLWLVYHDRNASFRENPGERAMRSPNPWAGMYDVVVEALDTSSFRVVAMERFSGITAARVRNANGLLAVYEPRDEMFPAYRLSRLRLMRPQ